MLEHHHLSHRNCILHYWQSQPTAETSRPWLVFTHGAGMEHQMFAPQIREFAADYPLLLWDMRGHGRSQASDGPVQRLSVGQLADDLASILHQAEIDSAVLVGMSLGGLVSQQMILDAPNLVAGLVMLGSPCLTLGLSPAQNVARHLVSAILSRLPYDRLRQRVAENMALHPESQAYLRRTLAELPQATLVAAISAVAQAPQARPGYRIDKPLLLLHGTDDETTAVAQHAPHWAKREPQCRYVVVPHSRHTASQDNPHFVNRQLRQFLQMHFDDAVKA